MGCFIISTRSGVIPFTRKGSMFKILISKNQVYLANYNSNSHVTAAFHLDSLHLAKLQQEVLLEGYDMVE
jgi:hypothetical protein